MTSASFVELGRYKVNEAYKIDPDIVKDPINYLKTVTGIKHIYHGLEVEESDIWWLVIEWQSIGEYHNFHDKKPNEVLSGKLSRFSFPLSRFHIEFVDSPQAAFEAPYTEFKIWNLRSGNRTDDKKGRLGEILKGLVQTYNGLNKVDLEPDPDMPKVTYGPIHQKDEWGFVVSIGWNKPESTQRVYEKISEIRVLYGDLTELAKVHQVHVPLTLMK